MSLNIRYLYLASVTVIYIPRVKYNHLTYNKEGSTRTLYSEQYLDYPIPSMIGCILSYVYQIPVSSHVQAIYISHKWLNAESENKKSETR